MTDPMTQDNSRGRVGGNFRPDVELAAMRPQLDALLSPVSDCVLAVRDDGTITYASPSVRHLLGFDPLGIAGRNLLSLVHPDDPATVLADALHRNAPPAENPPVLRLRRADETWREVAAFVGRQLTSGNNGGEVAVVLREATDRRHTLDALRHRLAFEDLITRLASLFLERPSVQIDQSIAEALLEVGTFARVDRVYLYLVNDDRHTVELAHLWTAPGVESGAWDRSTIPVDDLPTWMDLLRDLEPMYVPRVDGYDEAWARERELLEPLGAQSVLVVPVAGEGQLVGFLGFDSVRSERMWSDDHVSVLGATANIIAQSLARSDAEQRFGLAFRYAPLGMAVHAPDGRHVQVNAAYCALFGRDENELLGRPLLDFVLPDHHEEIITKHRPILKNQADGLVAEIRIPRPDGSIVWARVHASPVRAGDSSLRYTIAHMEDITERHRQDEQIRVSESRYRSLVENSPAVVLRFDRQMQLIYASPAAGEIVGGHIDEYLGSGQILDLGNEGPRWRRAIESVFRTGRRHDREWEVMVGSERFWFQSRAVPEFDSNGEVQHVLVLNTDITAVKRSEAELAHQALHDPLTGLANRTLLHDHLEHALARAQRIPGSIALLFLDLDRFKLINDSLGHTSGDELLVAIGRRLTHLVRPGDTVARLGGDEFVILLEQLDDPRDPIVVAERVREALTAPVGIGGNEVFTTTSIGIAVLNDSHTDADGLLRDADAAMYLAKARGRDRYEIFDEVLRTEAIERLQMENALRRSLDIGGLLVFYQPELDLKTGEVVGVEALARWQHPQQGLLDAGVFIALAEETGLILDLGTWVLRQSCRQAGAWQRSHPDRPLTVRVNLSARQIAQPNLIEIVVEALELGGIEPDCLCLEITETALMDDPASALKVLTDLRSLGVRLAIDDFGTGYSSLAYLKRFPVDVLKIDRSFVDGLGDDPEDTAIVVAIISMSRALGLHVVAEGVETTDQLGELRRLGCDRAQGWLFSRAVPPEKLWEVADSLAVSSRDW